MDAAVNTRPPAVAMGPPRFGLPLSSSAGRKSLTSSRLRNSLPSTRIGVASKAALRSRGALWPRAPVRNVQATWSRATLPVDLGRGGIAGAARVVAVVRPLGAAIGLRARERCELRTTAASPSLTSVIGRRGLGGGRARARGGDCVVHQIVAQIGSIRRRHGIEVYGRRRGGGGSHPAEREDRAGRVDHPAAHCESPHATVAGSARRPFGAPSRPGNGQTG